MEHAANRLMSTFFIMERQSYCKVKEKLCYTLLKQATEIVRPGANHILIKIVPVGILFELHGKSFDRKQCSQHKEAALIN